MTHDELCVRAIKWLRNTIKCNVVLTELQTGSEIPDAIGWNCGSDSWLVECKSNRADFFSDRKKNFRIKPQYGMGTYRYFLVPDGMVDKSELPPRWGLLYARKSSIRIVSKSEVFACKSIENEMRLLTSALRRVEWKVSTPLHEWLRWNSGRYVEQPATPC